ncbi:MAG: nitrous oxide reductase accessory protein NosL [Gemmatimonadetes bacterium]|nr:nitrous oxide reductase accessory protein NosL [Gemmatimonadota bacterium]
MKTKNRRELIATVHILFGALIALFLTASAPAEESVLLPAASFDPPAPGPHDRCAVCGMFPAKYPKWAATILFKDGHAEHFDGPKDLFKYMLGMERYAKGRVGEQIELVRVTDYYEVKRIDARSAFFVSGSDVLGPMGHELVPLSERSAAEEFMRDHEGERIVAFDEVDAALLLGLGGGKAGTP